MNDEDRGGLLPTVRGQDGLIDAVVEQHVVAQSGGVIGQRQEPLVGAHLGDVVENGDLEPIATPLKRAERGVQMEARPLRQRATKARTNPSLRRNSRG